MWLEYLQPWCSEKTQCTLRSQTRLLGDIFVLTQLFLVFTKEQKLLWYALWIGKAAYYPLKNKHPDTEHAYSRTPPQCHGARDCTAHQAPPEQNLSRGHPHLYPLLSHPSNLCLSANPLSHSDKISALKWPLKVPSLCFVSCDSWHNLVLWLEGSWAWEAWWLTWWSHRRQEWWRDGFLLQPTNWCKTTWSGSAQTCQWKEFYAAYAES